MKIAAWMGTQDRRSRECTGLSLCGWALAVGAAVSGLGLLWTGRLPAGGASASDPLFALFGAVSVLLLVAGRSLITGAIRRGTPWASRGAADPGTGSGRGAVAILLYLLIPVLTVWTRCALATPGSTDLSLLVGVVLCVALSAAAAVAHVSAGPLERCLALSCAVELAGLMIRIAVECPAAPFVGACAIALMLRERPVSGTPIASYSPRSISSAFGRFSRALVSE